MRQVIAFFGLAALTAIALGPLGCASDTETADPGTRNTAEDEEGVDEIRQFAIDDDDSGKTYSIVEGQNVVLKLKSNPTTGYSWKVVSTDRTFGYPKEDFLGGGSSAPVGSGGTQRFTWKTKGGIPMTGSHTVKLEYKRGDNGAPAKKFQFTIEINARGGPTCAAVRCAAGTHCEMKGLNGGSTPVCIRDAAQGACVKTGCSGHICADGDRFSTCEFRPEYGCYRSATCERQADGACGFTKTPALTSCLGR